MFLADLEKTQNFWNFPNFRGGEGGVQKVWKIPNFFWVFFIEGFPNSKTDKQTDNRTDGDIPLVAIATEIILITIRTYD